MLEHGMKVQYVLSDHGIIDYARTWYESTVCLSDHGIIDYARTWYESTVCFIRSWHSRLC